MFPHRLGKEIGLKKRGLDKGRHPNEKKNFSIRALPELLKPPHPPIRATLPTFSGRQKRRFARKAEKILMMIIFVAMILLIKILVILMIMMTKNTEKPTNIVNFG